MIKLLRRNSNKSSTLNIETTNNNHFVSVDGGLVSYARSKIEEGYRSKGQTQAVSKEPNNANSADAKSRAAD